MTKDTGKHLFVPIAASNGWRQEMMIIMGDKDESDKLSLIMMMIVRRRKRSGGKGERGYRRNRGGRREKVK